MRANRDKYDFDKIVSHRFPLKDAKEALFQFMKPESMKVVIYPE
jgi:threonine dehydrogenase-like Zn-dependent dehydrogenase